MIVNKSSMARNISRYLNRCSEFCLLSYLFVLGRLSFCRMSPGFSINLVCLTDSCSQRLKGQKHLGVYRLLSPAFLIALSRMSKMLRGETGSWGAIGLMNNGSMDESI